MYLDYQPTNRLIAREMPEPDWGAAEEAAQGAGAVRQDQSAYWDRYFGLQEQELNARMSQAARSSADSRRSLNAQMKAETNRLALAREQMERVGIPKVDIERYVAQKNYEIASLGAQLDWVNAYMKARQSPDMYWYAQAFREGTNKLGGTPWQQSQLGVETPTTTTPQPQSLQTMMADLGQTGGGSSTGGTDTAGGGGGAGGLSPVGTGASTTPLGGTDPRVQAINTMLQSSPPSAEDGLSADDVASLRTIGNIFKSGLANTPLNSYESMSPGQQGYLMGAGQRLGYDPTEELYKYGQSRWSQGGSATAA